MLQILCILILINNLTTWNNNPNKETALSGILLAINILAIVGVIFLWPAIN